MKLEQLYLLNEAVKYASISDAAKNNYMSQSSISHAIISLEKELQSKLLTRTCTGVSPTVVGQAVLKQVQTIIKSVQNIQALSKPGRFIGEIKLACIPCLNDWIVPTVLSQLQMADGKASVSVSTEESGRIVCEISSRQSDFGIVINHRGSGKVDDLVYEPLFHDQYVLYVGRHSPLFGKENVTYETLLAQPYIAYKDEFRKENGGLTNLMRSGQQPNVQFRTDSLDAIKSLIANDRYVAFFPQYMSQNDYYLQSKMIRKVRIIDQPLDFEVGSISNKKYPLNDQNKLFLATLKQVVNSRTFMLNQSKEGDSLSVN
ncbi:MAG: LysR family transcriptional regulator [Lentilactobacillus hilgardii]|uniref:LysR family transcriptional regulator n=2 Tax=Lentilactobacillus hilgardii TaxID=1588 RepID=UPI001CC21A3B|nr:LysR family transcriptional regulator [Lentilactobacillus hilgardii]MBZ2201723.1 hypothetical protein [Lentilactobacillus hilgardii]MBZ2204650.1 hypothetical protein [Lentilactobacillus hilgardii]